MNREQWKTVLELVIILLFFVVFSWLIQSNIDFVRENLNLGISGMLIYMLVVIASIVIAPVSVVPLMPLASSLWGWQLAGFLSVIGWTIGAVIAFLIARKYGVAIVGKLIPIDKIYKFEKLIPEENIFFTVLFLRMVLPVDGLSYFIGLFSKMPLWSYTLATLVGITPFAFVLSYAGTLNLFFQLATLALALFILLIGMLIAYYRRKRKKKH